MDSNNTRWWNKAIFWVFCIYTTFNSMPLFNNFILFVWQLIAICNRNHITNQVNTSNHFCNWVFYLQSCIHFKEIEVLVFVNHIFKCSCTVIAYFFAGINTDFKHFLPCFRADIWWWCFFYYFLVSSLDRTFPVIEMDNITMFITNYLNFYMVWLLYIFFNIYITIAKSSFCFWNCHIKHIF